MKGMYLGGPELVTWGLKFLVASSLAIKRLPTRAHFSLDFCQRFSAPIRPNSLACSGVSVPLRGRRSIMSRATSRLIAFSLIVAPHLGHLSIFDFYFRMLA